MVGNTIIIGGGGFIGRAILSQARTRWPLASFTVYGRDPMRLQHVRERYGAATIIGDVLDPDRLMVAFAGRETVIHAAAMKHIPEGEASPSACFRVNVEGSLNVIRAAIASGVKHLLMISTDKAADPANAYGLSKAMMERIAQEYACRQDRTAIHLVRYGNVVGSTGSVIPLFQRQLAEGKDLTVTHPDMTRFWLSPSMALDAIERALAGPSGSIYVPHLFAMSMEELAHVFCPYFVVTGKRAGEKMHECLMTEEEGQRAIMLDAPVGGYRIYPPGTPFSLGNVGGAFTSEDGAGLISPDRMREWIAEAAEL